MSLPGSPIYHWSGHRRCGVGPLKPEEARRLDYKCPVCGRRLTKGVEDRVEELADRPPGFQPRGKPGYIHLLPLQELIALTVLGEDYSTADLQGRQVYSLYKAIVDRIGSEFKVLLETPLEKLIESGVDRRLVNLISLQRAGKLRVAPGYDGVYGRVILPGGEVVNRGRLNSFFEKP